MNTPNTFNNPIANFNPAAFFQGYYQSAALAGAYSGYNPILMNFAGWMGGISNMWIPQG